MKKKILLVLLSIALVVSLGAFAACDKEEEEVTPPAEEEEEEEEEVWEWPDRMAIVSTGAGGAGYAVGTAWSTLLAQDTGSKIRMVSEDAKIVRLQWVKEGMFILTGEEPPHDMIQETGGYDTRDGGILKARIVYQITKDDYGYDVTED